MSLPESYSKYKFGKAVDATARMETTEDDEEGVENLLEFKGASRWEVFEAKDDVCITKMFEPKFLQIFVKYCEEAKPPIHSSGHLLVSCLENLVTFCCWARDSTARVAWMKEILDDNPDLRPEVRNGLAMVLVYVFSTAKAVNVGDADMFTVLQNPDSGLGIVNKTSLKIYNDPFMYFSFLKLCISGLIDAGKIPENERQNQPKKKRQSDGKSGNNEEIMAFMQLKTAVVALLEQGEHAVVRLKVQQIVDIWLQKNSNIRNRRFSTALLVMQSPTMKPKASPMLPLGIAPGYEQLWSNREANGAHGSIGKLSSGAEIDATAHSFKVSTGLSGLDGAQKQLLSPSKMLLPSVGAKRLHADTLSVASDRSGGAVSTGFTGMEAYLSAAHGGVPASSALSSQAANRMDVENGAVKSARYSYGQQTLGGAGNGAGTGGGRSFPSIPALRFERVGHGEWEIKENKIFNIESLIAQNDATFCLIDESKLSPDERSTKKLCCAQGYPGFVSLVAELQQRSLLITSWPRSDNKHLLDFLESWLAQDSTYVESALPLAEFWHSDNYHRMQRQRAEDAASSSSCSGFGVLAYEVCMQIGIILRRNDKLGITEDCWRLVYPKDLHSSASSNLSFGDFLLKYFPQLKCMQSHVKHDNGNGDAAASFAQGHVVIKYFPHKLESPINHAPKTVSDQAYRTIGTLDESSVDMLSRLDISHFHDIVLQLT